MVLRNKKKRKRLETSWKDASISREIIVNLVDKDDNGENTGADRNKHIDLSKKERYHIL